MIGTKVTMHHSGIDATRLRRRTRHALLCAVLLVPCLCLGGDEGVTTSAPSATKPALAVLDLKAYEGITDEEIAAITDRLRGELVQTGAFAVLERATMGEILKEQAFSLSGACDDQSCIIEVGKLLSVNKMVGGSIGKVGNLYSVNIKVLNVSTGVIEKQISWNLDTDLGELATFHTKNMAREIAGLSVARKKSRKPLLVVGISTLGAGVVVGAVLLATHAGGGSGGPGSDPVLTVNGTFE